MNADVGNLDRVQRLRRALDALVYLPRLKQGGSSSTAAFPSAELAAIAAASARARERGDKADVPSPAPPARPWDRGDLFRRAATFKPSTWFFKSPSAKSSSSSVLQAAARGWKNVGLDLLCCEFCGERLAAATREDGGDESSPSSFASRLVSCHASECPWRTGPACDLDLLAQFPPLTRDAAEADFAARESSALALDVLPPLSRESCYDAVAKVARRRLEALLQFGPRPEGWWEEGEGDDDGFVELRRAPEPPVPFAGSVASRGTELHARAARLLALYGWSAEIVAPDAARKALARLEGERTKRARAALSEAEEKERERENKAREGGGGASAAGSSSSAAAAVAAAPPPLPPPVWALANPLPSRPPASAMEPGSVRACDAALRCDTCGATAGLWSFVPSSLCSTGVGGGGEGEEGSAAAAAAGAGETPPAAKRTRGATAAASASAASASWTPTSTARAPSAAPLPETPRELDLVALHRSWCPCVDHGERVSAVAPSLPSTPSLSSQATASSSSGGGRVGWRWLLAVLVPPPPPLLPPGEGSEGEDDESDAALLHPEERKAAAAVASAVASASTPKRNENGNVDDDRNVATTTTTVSPSAPASAERATDRLRAALARAGIVSPTPPIVI